MWKFFISQSHNSTPTESNGWQSIPLNKRAVDLILVMILQTVAELKNTPRRIVSLVPSLTELLYYLGLENETIAITKFCVHPKTWKTSKIIIGGTKNVRTEQVKNLHPDLIIANKEENVKEQVEELSKYCAVWLTDINNFKDALQMILTIGELTQTGSMAEKLVENINAGFSQLTKFSPPMPTAYLIWQNPFMTIGGDTFINDMMIRCGMQNIFADKTRYPVTTPDEIKARGCRLLLLSSEPYPFKQQHIENLEKLLPHTKILLVDGEIFSWYGSRLLKAPGYLKKLVINIHPAAGK